MSKKTTKNLAASVRQKLLNKSKERKEDFQYLLTRYAAERLLYRLSKSRYSNQFILKGASLFFIWEENPHRPTNDVDLLGLQQGSPETLRDIFRDICTAPIEDDGLIFDGNSIEAAEIREDTAYGGIRVVLRALVENAKISLQIDIGFGDAVTPKARIASYPVILDFPAPVLRVYPRETVTAEKFQTMVTLGVLNSRMRDYYDLWILARDFEFSGKTLQDAIRKTFARRRTALPEKDVPTALTDAFYSDRMKQTQWKSFLVKSALLNDEASDLSQVVSDLRAFLMPPTKALAAGKPFSKKWIPGKGWK